MSGKSFWFPPLGTGEIVSTLTDYGLSVSQEQLNKPSPDCVLMIYTLLLQMVTGITSDELAEPVAQALATMEEANTDVLAHALSRNVLIYHLSRFADAAKVSDFSSRDLSAPEPDRTKHVISAMINFVRFIEGLTPFVDTLRSKSSRLIKEREAVDAELDDVQRKIRDIRAQRAKDEPQLMVLREENAAMGQQLIACQSKHAALQKRIEAIREEKLQVTENKRRMTEQVMGLESGVEHAKSRIVQSPERIRRDIATMNQTVTEDKRTVAQNETKARELQAKIAALSTIAQDVRSCVEQLQTLEKETLLLQVAQKDLADFKVQQSERESDKSQRELKQERIRQQYLTAHERLERAQGQADGKRLQMQQTIDRLQAEYEEMSLERRENDKQVDEVRGEADEIERQMAEHLKKSEAELNELMSEYWKLRWETDVYMEMLAAKLGMEMPS